MFDFRKVLQYLNIGSAVLAVLASAGQPQNLGDTVTLLGQIGTTVSPSLANDKNFQTIQKVLKSISDAEATGAMGKVGEATFSSHGIPLKVVLTVEPA